MKSFVGDDGRWNHVVRQSWLSEADNCAERARFSFARPELFEQDNDAAVVGTAAHTAIEACLTDYRDGMALDCDATVEVFERAYREIAELPTFRRVKWTTDRGPLQFGAVCVRNWWNEVLPTLPPDSHLEMGFDLPLYEDDQRVIRATGTIDHCHPDHPDLLAPMRDWKTSGRGEYTEWEYRRWAIQPTVYTWAGVEMGVLDPDRPVHDFEYVVLGGHGVQRFTVQRHAGDWDWMKRKALALCELIEADLKHWPLNDAHALCSEKWCGAWSECKGASMEVAA